MDLTFEMKNNKLNVRAGGIIIHNNKVLLHKNAKEDHYALVGGRVKIGESSENTVKREMSEELGKEVEVKGYISTIENFFEMKDSKYHEIMFVYKVEFTNEEDKKIEHTLKNIEGKDYLNYEWIDLEEIEKYKVLPVCIKEILKENKFPVHKINID